MLFKWPKLSSLFNSYAILLTIAGVLLLIAMVGNFAEGPDQAEHGSFGNLPIIFASHPLGLSKVIVVGFCAYARPRLLSLLPKDDADSRIQWRPRRVRYTRLRHRRSARIPNTGPTAIFCRVGNNRSTPAAAGAIKSRPLSGNNATSAAVGVALGAGGGSTRAPQPLSDISRVLFGGVPTATLRRGRSGRNGLQARGTEVSCKGGAHGPLPGRTERSISRYRQGTYVDSQFNRCERGEDMAGDVCRYGPIDDYSLDDENEQNHCGWRRCLRHGGGNACEVLYTEYIDEGLNDW